MTNEVASSGAQQIHGVFLYISQIVCDWQRLLLLTIPYHSLDDQEDEGEILVGMGLYDTPDKPSLPDAQLEQYRTAMISQWTGQMRRRVGYSTFH